MKALCFIFIFSTWLPTALAEKAGVLAPSALESQLTFKATVVMPAGMLATEKNVEIMVHKQTKHLLSEFESAEYAKYIGAPKNQDLGIIGLGPTENIKILSKNKNEQGLLEVTYKITLKVLVLKKFIEAKERKEISIFLPRDPQRIYIKKRTDKTYPQKEFFYYYWQPPYDAKDNELFTGKDQVDVVSAKLLGLTSPDETKKPKFNQLLTQARKRGALQIALLVGFDLTSTNPRDLGRKSYNQFKKWFLKNGFELDQSRNTPSGPFADFYRPAEGEMPAIHLSLSLSASDIANPVTFSRRAREAFEKADIVYYDGHSGLGGNLNFEKIAELSSADTEHPTPIKFSSDYQIFYFDSCASYYFYSQMYALAKIGFHNVDVVSNGLTSDFATQNPKTLAFLTTFFDLPKAIKKELVWTDVLKKVERKLLGCSELINVELINRRK
jgi:hypothetical protein